MVACVSPGFPSFSDLIQVYVRLFRLVYTVPPLATMAPPSITITSPVGHFGFAGQSNYASSKAGQVAFTKSLAKEVASRGITVNCVSPGFIDTDFIGDLPEEQRQAYLKMIPMKRFGEAAEVARSVLYLASRESSYITGAVLEITGGL